MHTELDVSYWGPSVLADENARKWIAFGRGQGKSDDLIMSELADFMDQRNDMETK